MEVIILVFVLVTYIINERCMACMQQMESNFSHINFRKPCYMSHLSPLSDHIMDEAFRNSKVFAQIDKSQLKALSKHVQLFTVEPGSSKTVFRSN